MKLFFVLLSLFLSMPWVANGAGYVSARDCAMKIQKDRQHMELATTACIGIRDSKTCQDFYKTLDAEDQNKKLTCSNKEVIANVNGSYLGDAALICAAGVIVDPVVALGTGIGEGIAKIEIAWEKASECNKSMDQKMALILAYNMDVPKLLKYDMPDKEKLDKLTCNMVNGSLQMHKRNGNKKYFNKLRAHYVSSTGENSLNEDEIELMEYNKKLADDLLGKRQGNIANMVEEMVKDLNLSLECYNPAQALAIRCEIAATIASVAIPSLFAIKAARLSKLTKVRLAKVEESVKDLTNLGRDGRIAKAQTEIATLGKEEKLKKLESEIGRSNKPLNEKEVKAYEKAHNVKSDDGEFYGTYSGKSLREKKRVLIEEGGFSEVEADFMIKRGYVGDAAPGVKAIDKATVDIKEHDSWKMYRGPTEDMGKKVFGRAINDDQVASIMIYNNAKRTLTGNYEKLKAEGIERMRTAGLSEKEIKSVVSGDFDAGRAVASDVVKPPPAALKPTTVDKPVEVSKPVETAKPSTPPTPAPTQNPYYAQAESNFRTDPIYNLGQKELNSTDAKKSIDQAARMKFANDNDRAGHVIESFQEDVAHVQRMRAKANAATTTAEKQKFEATVQVYSKRCKSWARIYEQAGYSNTSRISDFKKQIESYCK